MSNVTVPVAVPYSSRFQARHLSAGASARSKLPEAPSPARWPSKPSNGTFYSGSRGMLGVCDAGCRARYV